MLFSSRKFDSFLKRAAIVVAVSMASGGTWADAVTFVGSDGGDWDTAANWDTGTVPTASDDVTIDGKWVQSAGSITAKSILVKGANGCLTVAGTAKAVDAQVKVADRTENVVLAVSGDLVVNGGKFSLGARTADYNISATVGGNLVVSNGAVAAFYTGRTAGLDAMDKTGSAEKLYANANIITVTGEFRVGGGSTVYHENNGIYGTPLIFKVHDFIQEAGAVNSSEGRGWGKYDYTGKVPLKGMVNDSYSANNFTYAPGAGCNFSIGGGYGSAGGSSGNLNVKQVTDDAGTLKTVSYNAGGTYGFETAPFLSGSPNGIYSGKVRGSGAICIWATDKVEVSGTLTAAGQSCSYGTASGGGIWLAGARFSLARSATLSVEGGKVTGGYSSAGGAGRIALSVGLTQSDLDSCAAGTPPDTLTVRDLTGTMFNALGGIKNNGAGGRLSGGTAKLVRAAGKVAYEVTATPTEYSTATPAYGFYVKSAAEVPASFTTTESSVYPAYYRNLRRYSNAGVIATTASGEIAIGDIPSSVEPVTVTHQWTTVEDLLRLRLAGGGKATVNGTEYTAGADIWLTSGTSLSCTASAGSGTFSAWRGDIAGGRATTAAIAPSLVPGMTLWAVFSDAVGVARSYVGENWGYWDVAANWSPAGEPSPLDDVTVASKSVRCYGVAAVKSLTLSAGKLAVGGAATDLKSQTAPKDVVINDCGLSVAGNLTLTGASALSLGASRLPVNVLCSEVGGSLSLAGTSTLTVYPNAYAGALDDGGKIPLLNYYTSALSFAIGGDFTLADKATVYPECDTLTGTGVRFDVTGDVSLGASAVIDATTRGWGWINFVNDGCTDSRYRVIEGNYYTLCPGYGSSWGTGGAYGGGNASAPRMKYGLAYAPYLGGSTDGAYSPCRAGGLVWIKTPGTIDLKGKIVANGGSGAGTSSKSSGGGIWLVAKKVTAAPSASLQATGGSGGNAAAASGCGGRISLAIGVSDAELDALAVGDQPDTLTYSDTISLVTAEAKGANSNKDGTSGLYNKAPDGTLSTVTGAVDEYPLEIRSEPVSCISEGLDYATTNVEKGKVWSLTVGSYGFDPADPRNVRYACAGWVISNSVEEVASGSGTTASFTPEKGPFTLTWHWNTRETRSVIAANDSKLGGIRLNGASAAPTVDSWLGEAGNAVCEAVPAEDCEFLFWTGDVPYGQTTNRTLTIAAEKPVKLTPVFRTNDVARTRTWVGKAKTRGDWLNPANWSPANLPGPDDDVVLDRGTCDATNCIVVGSLTIGGDAIVRVAAWSEPHNINYGVDTKWVLPYATAKTRLEEAYLHVRRDLRLTGKGQLAVSAKNGEIHSTVLVEGDLVLAGTNNLAIAAGPTSDGFPFATGAGHVTVGGCLAVLEKSVLYVYSERYKGGSVVMRARRFELAKDASVNAVNAGFRYFFDRSPASYAPGVGGNGHVIAGGYGGYGSSYNGTKGMTYGFEYAPVQPGSPKGDYGDSSQGGGGLIRIHASTATIAGKLNARAIAGDTDASSGSGGGIWVTTSGKLEVADTAVLTAKGGYRCTGAAGPGGGGRIALGQKLTDAQVAELAATGTVSAWRKFAKHDKTEDFLSSHPGVTVDVENGENYGGVYKGTFRFLDGQTSGLMLIVR